MRSRGIDDGLTEFDPADEVIGESLPPDLRRQDAEPVEGVAEGSVKKGRRVHLPQLVACDAR